MANIWLSKVQKIFEIHRRIRPLSTQNKTLRAMIARWRLKAVIIAAIWLADIQLIDLSWHLIGCSKLNWQKFIKKRSVGNIGFWCSYIIIRGSKPSSWIEAKCLNQAKLPNGTFNVLIHYLLCERCIIHEVFFAYMEDTPLGSNVGVIKTNMRLCCADVLD